MKNITQAPVCLNEICFQRLTSSDFAQKQSIKIRLIRWMKGGAK
ncbi:hypothetical protein N5D11_17140 [Acinetobacter johnsonii]|uniref:Uncharacterized protein n=1 Tax=Acinetobacter johnsonii TaxID=40214 RepID=A0AA42IH50_ACIJO|nr:hypothetical protein [Acinetobacter johnsonii]MDH0657801.1 hypothetical protein [Acinetobacter johnsonii]